MPKRWPSLVPPMDLSVIHRQRQIHRHQRRWLMTTTTTMTRLMTAPPVGTNAWSFSTSFAMAQLKPPPLEVVFQPPNDPGVNNGVIADSVLDMALLKPPPADSVVLDDMFNAWRCGSCTYQNFGKAKGSCAMCNDPHPIRTGLLLDPWENGELETRSSVPLRQVAAFPPPNDQTPSDECHARQFCWSKSNEPTHFTICINCNGEVHMVCADLLFFQKPSKNSFIPQKDLSQHAKSRLRKMPLTERESVCIWFLCQDRIVQQRT